MSKCFTFLTALLLVLCSLTTTSLAQAPVFIIQPQQADGVAGDMVTVDIKAVNFTDLASYQFNLTWDPSLLSYQGVTNLDSLNLVPPPAPLNFGATNAASGMLVCSWADPFGLASSLSDSAIVFSVIFELLGDAGALEFIEFSGTIEVIQNDQFGTPMDVTDLNNFINGPATAAGYGGGGPGPDPCAGASGFTLVVETDTLPTGDQTCLDVIACNFTDLISIQYTMETDPALLRFDSVTNIDPALESGSLFAANNASNGFVTFNWLDSLGNGVTLPDETVLYSVCYTAVGAGGTEDMLKINSALTPIDVTDVGSNGSNIGLSSSGGEVVISGTSSSALTIGVSGTSGQNGDNICLDVTVNNFENISGLQYTMSWLPSILSFDRIELPNPLTLTPLDVGVNFNTAMAGSGSITFTWNGTAPGGLDLNNGDVIYQVCFDIVGSAGDVGIVDFIDTPTPREALQEDAMGMTQMINVVTQSGAVNVLGAGGFGLYASHETGDVGDTVCVDIGAVGFNAITSFQYILTWDTSVVEYVSFNNNVLPLQTFVNAGNAPNGRFTFQWLDNSTLGVTNPDSTILYDFCFRVKGSLGEVSPIRFIGELPTLIEATQDDGTMTGNLITIPMDTVAGSITVGSAIDPIIVTDTTITDINCFGDATGAIDIEVVGGTPGYTYLWSNTATTQDINGVNAGTYTVTITDNAGQTLSESYTINQAAEIDIVASPTGETCDGADDGSIDLTVSGGTGAYTYTWSDSSLNGTEDPTGLADGTYTVTVTDANTCTNTATAVVAAGAIVDIQFTKTDETCSGFDNGTIDLTVTGGSGNYSYVWSDPVLNGLEDPTGLADGSYTVTVTEDGNNCNSTATITINAGATLGITVAPTRISCNSGVGDGSIEVTLTGGSGNYNYVWSDPSLNGTEDPTGLATGPYTVTVTDNVSGCIVIGMATVTEPTDITATFVETNPTCNGFTDGAIDLTVSGGTGAYTYNWSNMSTMEDLTSIGAGNYTVTVTDGNGCTKTFSTSLTEPTVLTVDGTVMNESGVGANDGSINLIINGGTAPYPMTDWDDDTYDGNTNPTGLAPGSYSVTITDNAGCTATNTFVVNAADAPNPQVDLVTQITCNGADDGAITVSVTGGTTPYTYNWSNASNMQNLTGLAPGTYTLTVTDASGTTGVSQPVIIDEPALLTASAVATDVSCGGINDGIIDVTVSGGTLNYTYSWPGGIPAVEDPSGLAQGTYTVTVTDANGCTTTATASVGAPVAVGISNSAITDADCAGASTGAVDITPSGGDGNYTYNWSNMTSNEDLTGVPAGDYTVTITDGNGCSFTSGTFTVADGIAIVISNVSVTDVVCPGEATGVIDIDVSGGTPNYSYSWENNNGDNVGSSQDLIGLRGGTYTVTITDANGCTLVSNPIQVGEPQPITVNLSITNTTIANDDGAISVVSVTGGNSPFTYNWRGPAGTTSGNPITDLVPGFYFLTATDANGCVHTEDSILVVGVVDAVSDITNVSCAGGSDGEINVTIMGGISPFTYEWSDGPQFEDRTNLMAGTYTLTITDAAGTTFTETYVVTEAPPMSISNIEITPETGTGCNGIINISVTGGTPPYQYNWSNGMTSQDIFDVCKGKYSVEIIDANGCILQSPEYEVLPAALQLSSVTPTDVSCNGGSDGEVCFSTFGGCEPYNFELSTGEMLTSLDGNACFDNLPAGNHTATVTDVFGGMLTIPFTINEPSPIVVNVAVNDNNDPTGTNCNGAIQIDVSGGTQPYTYQWNNGMTSEDISGLCGDLSPYSVTIIDANGCVRVVRDIVLRTISFAVQDVSCFDECDGSIEITIVGGLSPFTYAWGDGSTERLRNNLCAGDYEVSIVNAQGQTIAVSTLSVNGPSSPLEITAASQVNPLGTNNDGSIDITVEGGWGSYTYEWTGPNGFTSSVQDPQLLVEGQYSVIITDANGCQITGTYTLRGERIEDNEIVNDVDCNGDATGSIILSPSGGLTPYTFTWSTGDNDPAIGGLRAGTYTCTITDPSGLIAINEYVVGEPPALTISFNAPGDGSATAIVNGGTPPYSYIWNNEGNDTTVTITGQPEGTYAVLVMDDNGCQLTALVEIEDDLPGFCDRVRNVITPNDDGNNDNFIIDCDQNVVPILQVFDRWGRLVFQSDNYQNDWEGEDASGSTLPEGGYFYVLEYDDPITNERIQEKGHLTILR